jgi:hypothetical protein
MTPLSEERLHELDVWLYVKELARMFPQSGLEGIYRTLNRYLSEHGYPGVEAYTIQHILEYRGVERWELASYFTQRGYVPRQIGQIMGIAPKSVSNMLARKYQQNPNTLQRWLILRETGNDMYGLQQATQVAQIVVPSRDFATLLR